ncbi:hypothetical protein BVAD3_40980 (plasmid) [Bacillus velezensis]|nr:hypothetical protein BVAD3_40980 [Bacillus velezensis]
MLDILKFIFSDFNHWLGSVFILWLTLEGLAQLIQAIRIKPKH